MNKKIFLITPIFLGAFAPLVSLVSCGSNSTSSGDFVSQYADDVAQAVSQGNSTALNYEEFPEADLYNNAISFSDLKIILPGLLPLVPVPITGEIADIKTTIINKTTGLNNRSITLQSNVVASSAESVFFTKSFISTITKFGEKLALNSVADMTPVANDAAIVDLFEQNEDKTKIPKEAVITALNDTVLAELKRRLLNIAATDYTLSDWQEELSEDALEDTYDLRDKPKTFKTTIAAKTDSKVVTGDEVLKVTLPALNQYNLSLLANFTAIASDFDAIGDKTKVSIDQLESTLRSIVVKQLDVFSPDWTPKPTSNDFLLRFEKTGTGADAGLLNDPMNLTVGPNIINIRIYANINSLVLINFKADWQVTIPALT